MSVKYDFEFRTADQQGAGTDSNIYVYLVGERGQTEEVRVNGYGSGNLFERGNTDRFAVPFPDGDVGDVYELHLRSDMKWSGAAWRLNTVRVRFVRITKARKYRGWTTFRVNEEIADTQPRTYQVSDGYKRGMEPRKTRWVQSLGAPYNLSKGEPFDREVRNSWTLEVTVEKATATTVSTGASVSGSYKFVSAAFEASFKKQIETRYAATVGKAVAVTTHCTLPPAPHAMTLREVWSQEVDETDFLLGDTRLTGVPILGQKRFSGMVDAESGAWVYRDADSEALTGPVTLAGLDAGGPALHA